MLLESTLGKKKKKSIVGCGCILFMEDGGEHTHKTKQEMYNAYLKK